MTRLGRLEEKKGLTFSWYDSGLTSEQQGPQNLHLSPWPPRPPTLGSSTVQRLEHFLAPGCSGGGVGGCHPEGESPGRPFPLPHRPQHREEALSPDARSTGFCHLLTSSRNNLLPWNQAKKFSLYSLNRRCVNHLQRKVSAGKGSSGHAF